MIKQNSNIALRNEIIKEIRAGYKLNNKVVQVAKVIVNNKK